MWAKWFWKIEDSAFMQYTRVRRTYAVRRFMPNAPIKMSDDLRSQNFLKSVYMQFLHERKWGYICRSCVIVYLTLYSLCVCVCVNGTAMKFIETTSIFQFSSADFALPKSLGNWVCARWTWVTIRGYNEVAMVPMKAHAFRFCLSRIAQTLDFFMISILASRLKNQKKRFPRINLLSLRL